MNITSNNTSIVQILPPEMLIEIFSYLDHADVKNVRLVSKGLKALVHFTFLNKVVLKLTSKIMEPVINEEFNFAYKLQRSHNFKNIKFDSIDFTRLNESVRNEILQMFLHSAEHLEFRECTIDETMLFDTLSQIINLKCFTIKNSRNYNTGKLISLLSRRVKTLIIDDLTDEAMPAGGYEMGGLEPTLEVLSISFKTDRTYKFFQLPAITNLFKTLQTSLKYLRIDDHIFRNSEDNTSDTLNWFNTMDFNLKLLRLEINESIDRLTFEKFTYTMKKLEHLDITCFESINPDHKELICTNMTNLKTLRFYADTFDVADYDVMDLTKLINLETFSIQGCLNSKLEEIIFSKEAKQKLKNLTLICDDISNSIILNIATNLPNLRTLALYKTTETFFPTKHLRLLFNNLKNLEELTIGNEDMSDEVLSTKDDEYNDDYDDFTIRETDVGHLQKLKKIDIFYIDDCPELSFFKLYKIPSLEVVEYTNAFDRKLTRVDVINLLQSCPKIKRLYLEEELPKILTETDEQELRITFPNKKIHLETS